MRKYDLIIFLPIYLPFPINLVFSHFNSLSSFIIKFSSFFFCYFFFLLFSYVLIIFSLMLPTSYDYDVLRMPLYEKFGKINLILYISTLNNIFFFLKVFPFYVLFKMKSGDFFQLWCYFQMPVKMFSMWEWKYVGITFLNLIFKLLIFPQQYEYISST